MILNSMFPLYLRLAPLSSFSVRVFSTHIHLNNTSNSKIALYNKEYIVDSMTNITPRIQSHQSKLLHLQKNHPLYHLRKCIEEFIYKRYVNSRGNPLFSVYNSLSPVVTPRQNFDSLLVASDHVSRDKGENYFINKNFLLRSHTSAHQSELIEMGLNNFLIVGDVYRRDTIDSSHYPVFHQAEGVRLLSKSEVFGHSQNLSECNLFQNGERTEENQGVHSPEVIEILSNDLKDCLVNLAETVIGKDIEWRWIDAYFPFTCPSWELEIKFEDKWVEMLGCGIMEQEILVNAGVNDKVGWAFGLGLERWAMKLYDIPDIRLFWSSDKRFISQFEFSDPKTAAKFQHFSHHPPCINDVSFWLPIDDSAQYCPQDFYDLVRSVGGDLVEQVSLVDDFLNPKTKRRSHCFRIVYRSFERPLTKDEVNELHNKIVECAASSFKVSIR